MNSQNNQNALNHFNNAADGIGYLNPSREVPVKGGKPYVVVDITALEGESSDTKKPNYVPYQLSVTRLALGDVDFIEQLVRDLKLEKPRVLVSFRVGITGINAWIKNDQSIGTAIRGRLIRLTSVSINGDKYDLPSAPAPEGDSEVPAEQQELPQEELPAPRQSRAAPQPQQAQRQQPAPAPQAQARAQPAARTPMPAQRPASAQRQAPARGMAPRAYGRSS